MKRATITISEDVEAALEAYKRNQGAAPSVTVVAEAALREYLTKRGYLASRQSLRITPVEPGSGIQDTSINHDRHFAGV